MQTQTYYPLSQITTLAIGGSAKEFVEVKSEAELVEAINYAREKGLEYLVVGGGSNLLVADEGVDKLVIKNSITGISSLQGSTLVAKSGTALQDLVDYSIQHGLSGLQKLSGIPGTVGGAIYGNAGAYGQSISDHLTEVVALDPSVIASPKGVAISRLDCNFGYRDSAFKQNGYIVLEAKFELKPGEKSQLEQEAKEIIAQRIKKYPPGIKCPGSFFKNIVASSLPPEILAKIPPERIVYGKIPAGALLEEVGAKGDTLGNIEIAPYHANLFINHGGGTAKDFYNLAKKYADLVYERFGIKLEPEVQLINLDALEAFH